MRPRDRDRCDPRPDAPEFGGRLKHRYRRTTMSALQQVGETLHYVFGGDFPDDPIKIHQVIARAVVVYLVGLAIIRIGKSRSIGRITPLDVILGFVLGSLLSRRITGHAS